MRCHLTRARSSQRVQELGHLGARPASPAPGSIAHLLLCGCFETGEFPLRKHAAGRRECSCTGRKPCARELQHTPPLLPLALSLRAPGPSRLCHRLLRNSSRSGGFAVRCSVGKCNHHVVCTANRKFDADVKKAAGHGLGRRDRPPTPQAARHMPPKGTC